MFAIVNPWKKNYKFKHGRLLISAVMYRSANDVELYLEMTSRSV